MTRKRISIERVVVIASALVLAACCLAPREADAGPGQPCPARCLGVTCHKLSPGGREKFTYTQGLELWSESGSTTAVSQPMGTNNTVRTSGTCDPVCDSGQSPTPAGGYDAVDCNGPFGDPVSVTRMECYEPGG